MPKIPPLTISTSDSSTIDVLPPTPPNSPVRPSGEQWSDYDFFEPVDAKALAAAEALRRREMSQSVNVRWHMFGLLQKSDSQLTAAYSQPDAKRLSAFLQDVANLSEEDIATLSTEQLARFVSLYMCAGYAARIQQDPEHEDIGHRAFNQFCQKLPAEVFYQLGWQRPPADPMTGGQDAHMLRFPWISCTLDNRSSLHALNACMPVHRAYFDADVAETQAILHARRGMGKHSFSLAGGLSDDLQNALLEEQGFRVHKSTKLTGFELENWLNSLNCGRCIIEPTRPGVQFPNGNIARSAQQAAIRRDENGKWWLLHSKEGLATPVNFKFFQAGDFHFKAVVPMLE